LKLRAAAVFACGLLLVLALAACASTGFQPRNVAKTDIDTVADAHLRAIDESLHELTVKLYRRNPRELKKQPGQTIDTRLAQLFSQTGPLRFDELNHVHSIDAMMLAFDDGFHGDRVFALMAGLTDMLHKSYGYKAEFFVLDELNQQKLYDSARNIEILVWRLGHRRDPAGQLYLLTNDASDSELNLSFERLFGKMISTQDLMASILADRTQRRINRVFQGAAAMAFLPI
jgi:hypothetical protein